MSILETRSSQADRTGRRFFDCIEADVPLGMKGSKAYRQGLNKSVSIIAFL